MSNSDFPTLQDCRNEIDHIDSQIIDLLKKRFDVVEQVVHIKERENLPVRIQSRIDAVIQNAVEKGTKNGLDASLVQTIWQNIVETSCQLEEKALAEKLDLFQNQLGETKMGNL